ncbi:MAG: hydantoinase B/oxoprolinase family protein [Chloroflexi bacterium]|nr:hydantoinase B/oxoprolinase family protein [Chloroflexota bacterium]
MEQRDPIFFEIFRNALNTIVDEMALTIYRTAYSGVLKDVMDYSTAFCDADGLLVAQGLTLPSHLGSIPDALAAVRARYAGQVAPDDIFCVNDPFEGGMHLPDLFVFKPIFNPDTGDLLAWAATICHHTDVGGRVAGSNASDSTEIYQEGLRIPPLKLYAGGEPNETLFRIIEKNVRLPVRLMGDLRAQLSACHGAEAAFLRLVARYGAATVTRSMADLIDYSERLTRAAIAALPDGQWSFEDFIDDDGVDYGRPIRLFVTVTVQGDQLTVDWTGSAPQVKGAINCTASYTKSATYCCIRSILRADIPNSEGFFRAVTVIAPPGTIAQGVLPAACAARGLTGFRMVNCCFGALAQMLPDHVPAADEGGNTGISIGGYDAQRRPFIYVDFFCSSWGGRPWADGIDGAATLFANVSAQPIEVCEREQPLEVLRCEFIQDSAGPGLHRGGASLRRDYRLLEAEAVLQVRADRFVFRPYGLAGGQPGRAGRNLFQPDTAAEEPLPGKFIRTLRRDEVVRLEIAGAGGWGDPLARDPACVLADVCNEFVSREAAERDYGVVLDEAGRAVDEAATVRERARRRGERPSA